MVLPRVSFLFVALLNVNAAVIWPDFQSPDPPRHWPSHSTVASIEVPFGNEIAKPECQNDIDRVMAPAADCEVYAHDSSEPNQYGCNSVFQEPVPMQDRHAHESTPNMPAVNQVTACVWYKSSSHNKRKSVVEGDL